MRRFLYLATPPGPGHSSLFLDPAAPPVSMFSRSRRFLAGLVVGAAASGASCLAALQLYGRREPVPDTAPRTSLEEFGFPLSGAETRQYINHALSYDQAKKTPRWVIEHLSKEKMLGKADRKHCKFKPDPNIPQIFNASNEDYLKSGWSRGHMAPAGDNKFSTEAMAQTFYLSNIVPQNYENNAGFWNRLEMYCRDLTNRFDDVWIVSGPLVLPQMNEDGKKRVTYQVIGMNDVSVPSHLYKVILAKRKSPAETLAVGAFVIPNVPIGFDHQLPEYQVRLQELEKMSGLAFFPEVKSAEGLKNLCEEDSCRLIQLDEFKLYIAGRRMKNARNMEKVEKIMSELKEAEIQPDQYLSSLYEEKKRELESAGASNQRERRIG
ncbi:nuclease EXOG, mitochondrial [Pelobates cultripes]|uniref:Nuclease EXOG, mitochondrial n=2 Tax=Pelobates cultripes TaxID=61616 RepID=A0AAD1RX04_PELCU|nr:nuclease EXOG, mitochondrial [Pelobates cultripes]